MTPRGHPDYVTPVTNVTVEGLAGLEELAARLGSIVPWNLEGNIVLMEDFESELTDWIDDSVGGTSTATRSSRHKFSGDWSAKLDVAGAAFTNSQLTRYLHYPGLLKYALFGRFCFDEDAEWIELGIDISTGTEAFEVYARYDRANETLMVMSTGEVYVSAGTPPALSQVTPVFYPFLLTFDLSTGYYDKLYLADTEYDISNIPFYHIADNDPPIGAVFVKAETIAAATFSAYVDGIILAKNVP